MTSAVASPVRAEDLRPAAEAAAAVAAGAAAAVDRDACFPAAAVDELRRQRLLAACLPAEFGGAGADVARLAEIGRALGRGCGSTALIWAMHQVQLYCVARHGGDAPALRGFLAEAGRDQLLVASVTSEAGIGGDLRTSRAAVTGDTDRRRLDKRALTVSYGGHADAYLVTARRGETAAGGDQVAVLIRRDQVALEQTSGWNPMGMRGTCSPGMRLTATFDAAQVLPEPFGGIAATTMVPLSHILWSAVWIGLATEAFERARRLARGRAGRGPGLPSEPRLARAEELLSGLEARLTQAVQAYAPVAAGQAPATTGLMVRVNGLKLAASTVAVDVAGLALEICGMAGYQEDGPYSVARILRDLHSARLMVANDRLLAANAAALLVAARR